MDSFGCDIFYCRDDDMLSTFSRVSGNLEDEDDDPTASVTSFKNLPVDTSISSQPSDSLTSTATNGIAEESVTAAASNGKVIN